VGSKSVPGISLLFPGKHGGRGAQRASKKRQQLAKRGAKGAPYLFRRLGEVEGEKRGAVAGRTFKSVR